ncbi:MAG: ACT domain-containing protein [Microlunatus sp.]
MSQLSAPSAPKAVSWQLTRHWVEVGMAQLPPHDAVPRWALDDDHETPFWSVTRTEDELSIVCAYEALPGTVTAVGPFAAFSIDGPLDHSLIGVLAGLTAPLADAGISILAQSTFDTDWILVPVAQADDAIEVWKAAGHVIETEED